MVTLAAAAGMVAAVGGLFRLPAVRARLERFVADDEPLTVLSAEEWTRKHT